MTAYSFSRAIMAGLISDSDSTGEIDINPSVALEQNDFWLDGSISSIPKILARIVH